MGVGGKGGKNKAIPLHSMAPPPVDNVEARQLKRTTQKQQNGLLFRRKSNPLESRDDDRPSQQATQNSSSQGDKNNDSFLSIEVRPLLLDAQYRAIY